MLDEWVREHGIEALGAVGGLVTMWFGLKRKVTLLGQKHAALRKDHEEHVDEQERKWRDLTRRMTEQRREDREDQKELRTAIVDMGERVEKKVDAAAEQIGEALKPIGEEILRLRERQHTLANEVMKDRSRIHVLEKLQGIEERT